MNDEGRNGSHLRTLRRSLSIDGLLEIDPLPNENKGEKNQVQVAHREEGRNAKRTSVQS